MLNFIVAATTLALGTALGITGIACLHSSWSQGEWPASATSTQGSRQDIENNDRAASADKWIPFSTYALNSGSEGTVPDIHVYVQKQGNLLAQIGSQENPLPFDTDVSTFEVWAPNDRYARDATHVFFEGSVIPSASPATFLPIGNGRTYAKDDRSVFCAQDLFVMRPIPRADPSSFTLVFDLFNTGPGYSQERVYALDQNNVYYFCDRLQGADPSTFEVSGYFSGKVSDAAKVYFNGTFGTSSPATTQ